VSGEDGFETKAKFQQNWNRQMQELGDQVRLDETVIPMENRDAGLSDFEGEVIGLKNVNQGETKARILGLNQQGVSVDALLDIAVSQPHVCQKWENRLQKVRIAVHVLS
jgi:hypothetical protein